MRKETQSTKKNPKNEKQKTNDGNENPNKKNNCITVCYKDKDESD